MLFLNRLSLQCPGVSVYGYGFEPKMSNFLLKYGTRSCFLRLFSSSEVLEFAAIVVVLLEGKSLSISASEYWTNFRNKRNLRDS